MLRNTVIVDGSNIATEGRSTPSLRQLDEAVRAFIADHPTENLVVIVDATFGHRIEPSERPEFEEAILAGELITPPAGTIGRGDAFILQIADKADATVLSNDSFQELHAQYPWLFDEGRLIGGKPVPGLGWVFILRTPVRGPVSRKVTREAKLGSRGDSAGSHGRDSNGRKSRKADKTNGPKPDVKASKQTPVRSGSGGADNKSSDAPINDAVPFFDFVGAHPVGSRVAGKIVEFSSHGAYADVEGVRCYVPLRLMGDPTPRSPKDVVKMDEERTFVLFALDPPRRGVDLALVASAQPAPATQQPISAAPDSAGKGAENSQARTPADQPHAGGSGSGQPTAGKASGAKAAVKKASPKKAPAKKAPAKKVAAKKTAAKKASPAKKAAATAAAKKTAATKATAKAVAETTAETTATKKVAAKKAVAKKAVAKTPAPTKKAVATTAGKKTAATETTTTTTPKKAPAKKAPVKKTTVAKKATAKKTAVEKSATSKAPAKQAAAKKAAVKKSTVKKSTTKKSAAKTSTAIKTAAKKSAASKTVDN